MDWWQGGEAAAAGTAMLWTIAALLWTAAGRHVGSLSIGFIRLIFASVFFLGYGRIARGLWWPSDADTETWIVLGISGLVGFFLADLCLFRALVLIGPRLTLLVQSLAPPITVLCSWLFLDDPLAPLACLGMAVTLTGVTWAVLERSEGAKTQEKPRHLRQGLLLAVLSAAGQAVAYVLTKRGLGDYDPCAGAFIRVLAAMVAFALLVSVARRWPAIMAAVRHTRAMKIAVAGAFVGPFLGVTLMLAALSKCHAGVAATIIGTTPILVLPFVIVLYRERVSPRAAGGALLAVVGVAILVFA